MDSLCVLIITDGRRDCFEKMMASWDHMATIDSEVSDVFHLVVDDSGDLEYYNWIRNNYKGSVDRIIHHKDRKGFGESIRTAWANIPIDCNWILHLEDDFTLNRHVNIGDMIRILKSNPFAAQVALYRQPWNREEIDAGGFYKQYPDIYQDAVTMGIDKAHKVVVHKRNFTTNPCVYPRKIMEVGWPKGSESEGHFGIKLLKHGYYFMFMGTTKDEPWVTHIGNERVGVGY